MSPFLLVKPKVVPRDGGQSPESQPQTWVSLFCVPQPVSFLSCGAFDQDANHLHLLISVSPQTTYSRKPTYLSNHPRILPSLSGADTGHWLIIHQPDLRHYIASPV